MLEQTLVIVGAALFGVFGTIHLVYTFFTDKFRPRDRSVGEAMRSTSPLLTRETTIWKAWIGFNASHSLGAMLFAAVYILLAARHMDVLRQAPEFVWLAALNSLAWLWLAHRYWFRIPLLGIALATLCFAIAAVRLS